jgi:murein peptide amidase A
VIAATPVGAHLPALVRREVMLGRSERGRPIVAWEVGDPASPRKALVVGCIHGNEPAGIAIANALARVPAPAKADVWIVPDLNPDGVAAGTRQNADGVDLNRNFPWRWRPLGLRGTTFYAGSNALSERESRIAYRLIRRLRPSVSIWFHQHLAVVDESGGAVAVERRFAQVAGLPMLRLARYPGSVTSWQNHTFPGTTAFVVELPAGAVPAPRVARYVRAIDAALR